MACRADSVPLRHEDDLGGHPTGRGIDRARCGPAPDSTRAMPRTSIRVANAVVRGRGGAFHTVHVIAHERAGRASSGLVVDVAGVGETVVLVHAWLAEVVAT
jgi:hypothetical protein